jgi:hypothetical protein
LKGGGVQLLTKVRGSSGAGGGEDEGGFQERPLRAERSPHLLKGLRWRLDQAGISVINLALRETMPFSNKLNSISKSTSWLVHLPRVAGRFWSFSQAGPGLLSWCVCASGMLALLGLPYAGSIGDLGQFSVQSWTQPPYAPYCASLLPSPWAPWG